MEASERDSTQDWEVPRGRGPLLIAEIEEKVDVAIAIARTSEAGMREIGETALDAARQARRAAEMAAAASAAAAEARDAAAAPRPPANPEARRSVVPAYRGRPDTVAAGAEGSAPTGEARVRRFSERCDRVSARLRALERRPAPGGSSAGELRRLGGG